MRLWKVSRQRQSPGEPVPIGFYQPRNWAAEVARREQMGYQRVFMTAVVVSLALISAMGSGCTDEHVLPASVPAREGWVRHVQGDACRALELLARQAIDSEALSGEGVQVHTLADPFGGGGKGLQVAREDLNLRLGPVAPCPAVSSLARHRRPRPWTSASRPRSGRPACGRQLGGCDRQPA